MLLSGTQWMSWTMLGSVAVCIPVLLLHRDSYNRLDVDEPVSMPNTDAVPLPCSTNDITFNSQHTMSEINQDEPD